MSFTSVTLTGTYAGPAAGTVQFKLTSPMVQPSLVSPAVLHQVTLDGSGHFSIALPATNDPATGPIDVAYEITELITGTSPNVYYILLPYNAAGGTIDITACPVVLPTPNPLPNVLTTDNLLATLATFGIVPSSGSSAPTGPAGGDLNGSYPNPGVAKLAGVPASGYVTSGVLSSSLGGILQDVPRRYGSAKPNLAKGMVCWAPMTAVSNPSGDTILVTSSLNPPVGTYVTIAESGWTNVDGTWQVTAASSLQFEVVVTSTPSSGSLGATPTASYVQPVIDVVIGDSIAFGEGAHNLPGIGYTDNATVLSAMENQESGFPFPGRGFRRCNAPFFGPDTWDNLAVGSAVTTSGPIPVYSTSWQLTTTGQIIGLTQPFRRAVVFFKKRSNGDAVRVSFDGGSTWTATIDTSTQGSGVGYFGIDSADLGSILPRTIQVEWESHVAGLSGTGAGSGGLEVAGVRLYMTSGTVGAYNDVLASSGTTAQEWVANTDWDTYWLPMVQPRRVRIALGVNDLSSGRTLSQLQTDLTTIVTRAQAAAPLAEIVLVAEYHPGNTAFPYDTGITAANWEAQYCAMVQGVANANNCTYIDLFAWIGDVSVRPGDSGDPLLRTQTSGVIGLQGDGIHLGDAASSGSGLDGQESMAEAMRAKLSYSHPFEPNPAPGWKQSTKSWTRIGNTSFVIPYPAVNAVGTYKPGTKVRWAESGVVKYGVVASSVHGTAGTLVNLGATSDYVMAASPDNMSNWYSFDTPPDFPHVFSQLSPTFTGASGGFCLLQWSVSDGWCTLSFDTTSSLGASANTFTMTNLPIPAAAIAYDDLQGCLDNVTPVGAIAVFASGSSTVTFLKTNISGAATWQTSGPRQINGQIRYPI